MNPNPSSPSQVEKLLPCPFCGKEGKLNTQDKWSFVECAWCASRGCSKTSASAVIARWNTRANEEQAATVEETQRLYDHINEVEKQLEQANKLIDNLRAKQEAPTLEEARNMSMEQLKAWAMRRFPDENDVKSKAKEAYERFIKDHTLQ